MDKAWKVILAFVGVFIAGAVFGAFFSLRIGGRLLQVQGAGRGKGQLPVNAQVQQQQRPLLGGLQPVQAPQIMRRYAERLDLTAEQKERINPLIQRATEDIRRQQQTNFRENSIIVQRLQQDIAKELTPEQRGRLEKMEQKQRELLQTWRGADRPGGPGQRPREKNAGAPKATDGAGEPKTTGTPASAAPTTSAPSAPGEKK